MSAPGRFLITFDVELLWGLFFDDGWRRRALARYGAVRDVFGGILDVLRKREVRATFAVTGHLFLDRCGRVDGRAHPEMPRPKSSPFPGDWYELDPGTDLSRDPLWYGRDLVEKILAATPEHEIGVHGFSHAFLDSGRELARAEMRAARETAATLGLAPRSFVYPRNAVGFVEELAPAGYSCYREAPVPSSRAAAFLRRLFGSEPPVGHPRLVSGVVEIPGGIPILPAMGVRRLVPLASRVREVRRGLVRARDERALFHLWSHPHNFVEGSHVMLRALDRMLGLVEEFRERGEIEVATMGEVKA